MKKFGRLSAMEGFAALAVFGHRGFCRDFEAFAQKHGLERFEGFVFFAQVGPRKFEFAVFATKKGELEPKFVGFCECEFGGTFEEIVGTRFVPCFDEFFCNAFSEFVGSGHDGFEPFEGEFFATASGSQSV